MRSIRIISAAAIAAVVSLVSIHAQYGGAQAPAGERGAAARGAQQPNVPTPKAADGHPDLSGFWGGGGGGGVSRTRRGTSSSSRLRGSATRRRSTRVSVTRA